MPRLLFEAYRDAVRTARVAGKRATGEWDGLAEWRSVKRWYTTESAGLTWAPAVHSEPRQAFYAMVMQLPEADEHGNTHELHHFIMQCARIPVLEAPSPRKIMQLALNVGQLESEIELLGQEALSPVVARLYADFQTLNMHELSAYIVV